LQRDYIKRIFFLQARIIKGKLEKQKRVGRFLWKNLEAKPLNFEPAWLRFIKSRCKGQGLQFTPATPPPPAGWPWMNAQAFGRPVPQF